MPRKCWWSFSSSFVILFLRKIFQRRKPKILFWLLVFLRSDNLRHRQGQSCYDHQHLLMLGRSSLCGSNFLNKFGNDAFLNNWELFYDCVKTRTVCCIAKIFFWCSLFCWRISWNVTCTATCILRWTPKLLSRRVWRQWCDKRFEPECKA